MNEEKKTPQQANHTPPPEDPSQVLSPRRRSALVTYLAVLFAIAFLFVAVMFVAETRRLKTMNEELKDSSQKTSASLSSNLNALQEENQRLSGVNDELNERIEALKEEIARKELENSGQRNELDALIEKLDGLQKEKQELETRLEAMTQQAADAVTVSELLQQAIAADEDGDMEQLQALLEQIEPLKTLLSASEQEWYESLAID